MAGFNLSARCDAASNDLRQLSLDIQAVGGPTRVQVQGAANAGARTVDVLAIKVTHNIVRFGGTWALMPQYHLKSKKGNFMISYGSNNGSLTANLKPYDSLNILWRDNAWTTNVNVPIKGLRMGVARINVRRNLSL